MFTWEIKDEALCDQKYVDTPFCQHVWLGPLIPLKTDLNATEYNDTLENCAYPTLWQCFGEDPFPFQHDSEIHKNDLAID